MKQKTLDMIKRLTSLLLVFATCLGILPQFVSPAYAAGKEWRYIWLISQPSPLLCISSDNGTKQIKEVYIANMTTEADRAAGAPKRFLKCKEKTIAGEVYWVVDNDYAASSNADSPMADLVDQGAIDPLNAVQASDSTAYPDVGYVRLVSNFTNSTATDIKGWEDASFEYVPNSQKPFDPDTITEQNQDTTFWAGNKQGNKFATVTPGPDEWVNHIVSRVGRSDENQEYPGGYYPSFLNIRDLPRFDEPDTVYYAQIALRASDVAALVHEKDLAGEWEDGVCYINAPNNAQFQFKSVRELPDPERGNLIIRKIDSLTGKALANVSFKIEQVDGGYTSSIQTGGNGEATLDGGDLKTGSYIVTEINSATGHVLNTAPQTFAWVEGQKKDIALTFTNDPKGGVDIYKYDEDTNAALEGAAFDIYKDGKKISSLITDGAGHATINNLSEGHYQVIEVNPPAGYLKDTKPYEVYVDPADTNGEIIRKLNIPNHKKISLRILKVDAGSRTPLAGFQFDVTKDSQPYTSGTTDENGEIVLTNLEPGTYRVHEAGGSEEYIIDAPDQEIEITGTETEVKTLTFENTKKVGYWLLKLDEETGAPIPHAVFSLTRNGQEVGRYETDATGYVKLENVEPGTYVAKEESVPSQYIKSDETFLVEIDKNSTGPVIYTVTNVQKKDLVLRKIDEDTGEPMQGVAFKIFKDNLEIGCQETDAEGLITLPYADPGSYRFEEYRTLAGYELNTTPITVEQTSERTMTVTTSNVIRKKLTITKVDEKTKKPLEGVTFEIFKDNELLGHYTTDKNGQIIIEHAPPGSYRAVEIDTLAEYIMNTESKTIEHTLDKDSEMLFANIHRPGLWIKKLDGITGNPLKGAKFQIWASPEKSEGSMQDLGTFFTNENGEIVPSTESGKYLKEGWYRVKEVQAPTGYIISGNDTQEVFLSNGDYATLTFQDQPLSALVIWKNDSRTGRGVEGATFQVRYLEGNSGTGGNVVATVKTGTNGSVSVTDLKPGTYIVEEIAAPNGYIIDTAPQTVFISGDEQKVVEVSFSDSPYGDLLIKKMDSVTKQPLQGVVFKVKTADGTVVGNSNGEFATNEDGAILVNGIEPHTTLVVNEISTIPGYVLDTTPKTVETIPGETVTVTFTDQPKSTLIVEKYDEVTGDPLQGVEFKIIPSDGKLLTDNESLTSGTGLYTTDHNGQITLTNLTPGSYVVTETKPLDGYSMTDGAAQTVVLSAGQTYRVRFYNTPDGNLMIKKIDSVTGAPLAGVEFKIECLDNGEFRSVTKTTDQSGVISLSRIPTGTYKVTETRALDGYELDDVAQTAFVEPGKTAELTFRNRPLGGLLIKKKDSVTGEPISGVTFKVSRSSGAVVGTGNGEFTTDAGGFISIPDLDAGTYIVQEIRAKEGYVLDNSVKTIEVKDHQTYTLEFYNQPYGKIIVNKIDSETKKTLEGVEFEIKNSAGELVGDHPVAEGVTTGSSSTGQISSNGKMTTDSQGHITLNSVKPDTYTITEIATIPGYILDSTPRSVIVGPGDTQTITIGNSPKGSLQIRKIDSATKEPLEGVKFKITNSNGDNVANNEGATSSNGIFTTDENGEINIGKLEPDTYTVTEIETVDGYVKDAQPQTVRVNSNDKQVLTFTNAPKGSLIVRKIDSVTKEPLTGVKFKIIMSNGELITGNGGASGSNGIYTTDNNGEIVLTKLKPGAYSVTETETIEGYEMDAQPQSVLISNNSAQTLTFTNTPRGGLIIKKMDSITKEPLSDVTFKVTTTDGTIVGGGNGEYTTDSEGFIRISKMPPTTYIVQEVRAKTGYVLDNTPKTINIKDHQTYTLDVYNQPYGGLIIHKTDSVTKKPLAGVEFRITTADGQLVPDNDGLTSSNGRYVTDATGEIKLSNVKPGTYIVTETKTLDGYVIDAEPQTVVVNPADIQTLNFTNAPKSSLSVRIIDKVTKEPLPGAKVKIVNTKGELIQGATGTTSSNGIYTADENGEISLGNLPPDAYTIVQTETIDGYVMDSEPATVVIAPGDAKAVTLTNTPKGGLVIKKMDAVTKAPISDVLFKVTTQAGTPVGTSNGEYRTDANGFIQLTKLDPGFYVVKEVEAKSGYVLDDTPKTIEVKDHQTYTLEVFNRPKGGLVIRKVDTQTREPLAGVQFEVRTAAGTLISSDEGLTSSNGLFTTDEKGEITIEKLTPGTYTVTEIKTIDGYVMDSQPQTVVVGENDTQVLTFTNTRMGSLVVTKIDSATRKPLQGVTFRVQGEDEYGFTPGNYTTDVNGQFRIDNIPSGVYTVQEMTTIDGYKLDDTAQTVKIESGKQKNLTFTNDPLGGLLIKKMDSITKEPLSEVTFKVTTPAGVPVGSSNGEFVTDSRGYISITDIEPGTYIVEEVQAKSGYVLDRTPKTITVKDHQTYTLKVYNQKKGQLVVYKIDSVTKEPLQGVEFEITTADGSKVATDEGLTSTNGRYVTNEKGQIVLDKLMPDTYVVTETKTIDGYRLDAPPQTVVIGEGDTQTLTFTNTPMGGLLIKKMNSLTKEPLADVIFKITAPDGVPVGTSNGEYHTDEYGYISLTDLKPGTYVVKEVQANKGYILDDTPKTIVVKDHETYTLEVFNQPKGGLIVRKIDSKTREPLAGVEFKITTASGELVATNEGLTSSNGIYTTNDSGEIVLEKLMPGTYIVTETKCLDGYMMDAQPQTVVIGEGDTQTLTFTNTPGASLVIKKIDSKTRKPISGVEFEVKGLASVDYPQGSYITDVNGMIRLNGIPTGAYTVCETRAKDGYQLDNTPQTIQINAGETKELTFENDPLGSLTVTVKDANTREPLAGVVVKITTLDGTIVGSSNGEFITDNNGTIVINNIASGGYIVQEIRTLNGYILDDAPKTIEINDMKNYLVEILNHRKGGLLIRKVDAKTKEPLAGVEFKITTASGEFAATNEGLTSSNGIYTTDENGEIALNRLQPGTYVVTENKTIDGYIMDAAPQTVVVNNNDTQVLTFTNTKQSGLVIRKIDEDTRQPLKNALFSIKKASGEVVNGRAETDIDGLITIDNLEPGAYIVAEEKAPDGYVLQDAPVTVELKKGVPAELTFTNRKSYGIQIRSILKGTHDPVAGCKFEVKTVTGEFIGSYETDFSGLVSISVNDGIYVVTQITAPEGMKFDKTPQNVIVKAGAITTVTFENEIQSGIRIKLLDAVSKKGIYNVRFLIKTEGNKVVGEYTTDQDGCIEINNLLTDGVSSVKYKVEQISSVSGYEINNTVQTLVVNLGEITELTVENTPVLGQIQIVTKAGQDNIVTNQVKGSLLANAVYEITDSLTGRIMDTVTSDSRGIAATNPIPLGTYYIQQIQAPQYYQLNNQKVQITLKVKGDVIRVEVYNDASNLKTTIQQSGNYTVDAGSNMRYDITNISNNSNVSVTNFYWHDRIPTDAVRVGSITTGAYNARAWYKITYKTNKNDYRTLASNLLSTSNYSFKVDAGSLKLGDGEYVTDIRYEFSGTIPAGFKMTQKATMYVYVPANIKAGYTIINRADVGGSYQGEWDSSTAAVTTTIVAPSAPTQAIPNPSTSKLPQTGY